MSTVNAIDSLAAAAVEDDPFFQIVLADPELLRSEFDGLIDASWGPTEPGDGDRIRVQRSGRPGRSPQRRHDHDDASSEIGSERCVRRIRINKRGPPPRRR